MRDPCVIYFGVIPMIDRVGEFLPEEQASPLAWILVSNSMNAMVYRWSVEHINLLWMGTTGLMINPSLPSFPHPTIVIDVGIKQQLWKWMNPCKKHSCNLIRRRDVENLIWDARHQNTFCSGPQQQMPKLMETIQKAKSTTTTDSYLLSRTATTNLCGRHWPLWYVLGRYHPTCRPYYREGC